MPNKQTMYVFKLVPRQYHEHHQSHVLKFYSLIAKNVEVVPYHDKDTGNISYILRLQDLKIKYERTDDLVNHIEKFTSSPIQNKDVMKRNVYSGVLEAYNENNTYQSLYDKFIVDTIAFLGVVDVKPKSEFELQHSKKKCLTKISFEFKVKASTVLSHREEQIPLIKDNVPHDHFVHNLKKICVDKSGASFLKNVLIEPVSNSNENTHERFFKCTISTVNQSLTIADINPILNLFGRTTFSYYTLFEETAFTVVFYKISNIREIYTEFSVKNTLLLKSESCPASNLLLPQDFQLITNYGINVKDNKVFLLSTHPRNNIKSNEKPPDETHQKWAWPREQEQPVNSPHTVVYTDLENSDDDPFPHLPPGKWANPLHGGSKKSHRAVNALLGVLSLGIVGAVSFCGY